MSDNHNTTATLNLMDDGATLCLKGPWTGIGITALAKKLGNLQPPTAQAITFECTHISQMDSAGAWLLHKFYQLLQDSDKTITIQGFNKAHKALFDIIQTEANTIEHSPTRDTRTPWLFAIGKHMCSNLRYATDFLGFIGEALITFINTVRQPKRMQWGALINTVYETGYRALPIVALLVFAIGLILSYQMGIELKTYGASIFIVNLSGIAILREFAPLITAIIVAGRTSSAFTAQIGTMKVNEEIDALRTMGLSPINRLVVPKVFGLIIALPLLTVWADGFGMFGSMVMAKAQLGIGFTDFLQKLQDVVSTDNYWIGIVKAPVFAMIIAIVGCFQGFEVKSSAESVGWQTTKSVVEAIFLIIIADAIFSLIFSWEGI